MNRWILTADLKPDKDTRVDWISPAGHETHGGLFAGGLIWYPPNSEMYVYYTPVMWRPAAEKK